MAKIVNSQCNSRLKRQHAKLNIIANMHLQAINYQNYLQKSSSNIIINNNDNNNNAQTNMWQASDKQHDHDLVARSHELIKRQFFEKLERRGKSTTKHENATKLTSTNSTSYTNIDTITLTNSSHDTNSKSSLNLNTNTVNNIDTNTNPTIKNTNSNIDIDANADTKPSCKDGTTTNIEPSLSVVGNINANHTADDTKTDTDVTVDNTKIDTCLISDTNIGSTNANVATTNDGVQDADDTNDRNHQLIDLDEIYKVPNDNTSDNFNGELAVNNTQTPVTATGATIINCSHETSSSNDSGHDHRLSLTSSSSSSGPSIDEADLVILPKSRSKSFAIKSSDNDGSSRDWLRRRPRVTRCGRIAIDCVSPTTAAAATTTTTVLHQQISEDVDRRSMASKSTHSRSLLRWFSSTAAAAVAPTTAPTTTTTTTSSTTPTSASTTTTDESSDRFACENDHHHQPISGFWGLFLSSVENNHERQNVAGAANATKTDIVLSQQRHKLSKKVSRKYFERSDAHLAKSAAKEPRSLNIYSSIQRINNAARNRKSGAADSRRSGKLDVDDNDDDDDVDVDDNDTTYDDLAGSQRRRQQHDVDKPYQSMNLYENLKRNYATLRRNSRKSTRAGIIRHDEAEKHDDDELEQGQIYAKMNACEKTAHRSHHNHNHHNHHHHHHHHHGHSHNHHRSHSHSHYHSHRHHSNKRHSQQRSGSNRCGCSNRHYSSHCTSSLQENSSCCCYLSSSSTSTSSSDQMTNNCGPCNAPATSVSGQLIKICKSDGSQVIELQRAAGRSWGFFVARGAINNFKGIFISRMHDDVASSSLAGLLGIGDRILAIDDCVIEPDYDILRVNQMISKTSKILLKVKPFKS